MAQVKRETAYICLISDIIQGNFVKAEGWNPSYVVTAIGNLSRINLMGVLVSREDNDLVLDDGSGRIILRSFEEGSLNEFNVGDFVTVIGRPRAYNEQKYIVPEIIKKTEPTWAEYRKKQIEFLKREQVPVRKENKVIAAEPTSPVANQYQKIIEFIRDLDAGDGAEANEVAGRTGFPNAEMLILKLIEEGEIFEIKPGRLKILE